MPEQARPTPDRGALAEPLDAHVLADLRALGSAFLRDSISMFLGGTPAKLAALRQAVGGGDRELVRQKAHKLRGSCGLIGARRMMDLCARLEELAHQPDADGLEPACQAVDAEFASVEAALKAELSALSAAPGE
jgi:HPt (histidine-containing phosphotransfer) domain-containing protein